MQSIILIHSEIVGNSTDDHVIHCFPTSGCDPNQGREGSDVGLRAGFMENSIITDLLRFYLKQVICLTKTRVSYVNKSLFIA